MANFSYLKLDLKAYQETLKAKANVQNSSLISQYRKLIFANFLYKDASLYVQLMNSYRNEEKDINVFSNEFFEYYINATKKLEALEMYLNNIVKKRPVVKVISKSNLLEALMTVLFCELKAYQELVPYTRSEQDFRTVILDLHNQIEAILVDASYE